MSVNAPVLTEGQVKAASGDAAVSLCNTARKHWRGDLTSNTI